MLRSNVAGLRHPRRSTDRRSVPRAFLRPVLAGLVLCAATSSLAADSDRVPARATVLTGRSVTFRVHVQPPAIAPSPALEGATRVTIPGFSTRGNPGEPALPVRQFLVALPPAGTWSLSYRIISSQALAIDRLEPVPHPVLVTDEVLGTVTSESYRYDPDAYGAFTAPPTVEALDPAWIRRNRVLPVLVSPLAFDPAAGEAVLAEEVEVTVTFSAPADRSAAPSPPEGAMWDGIFARMVVNPGQARQWRAPSTASTSAALSSRPEVPATQSGLLKISVRATGIHRVTASRLIAAGFPMGRATGDLHLFQRTYDDDTMAAGVRNIAYTVEEDPAGVMGTFDGNDELIFYGRRLRDDPDQGDTIEKFSDHNVYWLEPSPGVQMARRALAPGFVTADTATTSFPVAEHFEVDREFWEAIRPQNGPDFYMYNLGGEAGPIDLPIDMRTVVPGSNVSLEAELHGQAYITPRLLWVGLSNSGGEHPLDPAYSIPSKNRQVFTASVPAATFDLGPNQFRIRRPDASRTSVQAILNWVEVSYQARYRARGNALAFNTASLSGDTSITVTGISDPDLWLFDVTDPDNVIRCDLDAGLFPDVGGSLALSFRDNIAARKRYVLMPESRMIEVAAADIVEDDPSFIIGSAAESGVDVLVVSHADFIPQMNQWVGYRRAQGYRVLMVDVEDVCDEFNNGILHARAIDRFVQRFYELGNAGALVLVGDSSEDNKRIYDGEDPSGINFVPTRSFVDHVSSIQLDEVVTSDKLFVKLPNASGFVDQFPDMVVGRLPVGSTSELAILLGKIFRYEEPSASDFWRRRMIIIADDAWSAGGLVIGGAGSCYYAAEEGFRLGQAQTAETIRSSLPAGYDVVEFYLSDYTDNFHASIFECDLAFRAIEYARDNATTPLLNELSKGATLVTIQAHMNRYLVTHEKLFVTQRATAVGGSNGGADHQRLDNRGMPFVIFGMGCHFSDYALHREESQTNINNGRPNGDCFAEQLILRNNEAAIASYGSSGFEFLSQTNAFMRTMAQVWFYSAPYDTMINQTRGQWVLGELMFLVEGQLATSQTKPVERYHILGDPLLRIDAGPPGIDVTVNGAPFENDDIVAASDTIDVVAVVTDENAIQEFELEIAGADASDSLTIVPLVDQQLPHSRQYQVSFRHVLRAETYKIILRALQAPDTIAGQYHMAAEFTLNVLTDVSLAVNGRVVADGDNVPSKGSYRIQIRSPVFISESEISVSVDSLVVADLETSHPSPEDSTTWVLDFSRSLDQGRHVIDVSAGPSSFQFIVFVSLRVGLFDVVPYPNPFRDHTQFVFRNDVEITDGTIDVYTVSGKRIRRIDIPPNARQPGQNAVFWDGRDETGDEIANGTYLFVVRVTQRGQPTTVRGKLSLLR